MKPAARLKLVATTWTLTEYPSAKRPWSPARQVREIVEAGFEGVQARHGHPILPLARAAGLEIVGGCDFGSVAEVEPRLRALREDGAVHVNCQVADHDTPTSGALPIVRRIISAGDRLGMKPAIEVHRDTCTETPEKAFALADAYRRATGRPLRMNFDHSHPAIVKHLAPPYWARLGERLDLLRMGELIHLRPFNGHHCQIPVTDGRGRLSPEFQAWLPFCESAFAAWLAGGRGRTLLAVPELGPRAGGYCLSAFPDVWEDKLVAAREIRKAWGRALKKAAAGSSRRE
jgi:hypothetical protein